MYEELELPDRPKSKPGVRGRPFQPGNKAGQGRPKGSRNKSRLPFQERLDAHADEIIDRCIELAREGDAAALRLCMERIVPPRRDVPVEFEMPEIRQIGDIDGAMNSVIEAVSGGEITPTDGAVVHNMLHQRHEVMAMGPLEERLRRIEEVIDNEKKPAWGSEADGGRYMGAYRMNKRLERPASERTENGVLMFYGWLYTNRPELLPRERRRRDKQSNCVITIGDAQLRGYLRFSAA
jgi:hypothetical protein